MEAIPLKVVLLGESGVGKTSIINRFMGQRHDKSILSSLSAQFVSKMIDYEDLGKAIKFDIWDTVGQERFRSMAKIFYKDAKIILLVYDITSETTFDAIKDYWYGEIKNNCDNDPILVIIGNKSDLYMEEKVEKDVAKEFAKSIGALFYMTSALSNQGINPLFEEIGRDYLNPICEKELNDKKIGIDNKKIKLEDNQNDNQENKGKKRCCK